MEPFSSPILLLGKVGCYWTFKFHLPGVPEQLKGQQRRECCGAEGPTLTSRERVASRIYFPKFRRARFLWKDKIIRDFSVTG